MGGLTSSGETESGAACRQATAPTEQCVDGGYRSTSSDSEPEGGWAAKWAEEALEPAGRGSSRQADANASPQASESKVYGDAHEARGGGGDGQGGGWEKPCGFASGAAGLSYAGSDHCGCTGCSCWCWEGGVDDGRGAAGGERDAARAKRGTGPGTADIFAVAVSAATTAATDSASLMDVCAGTAYAAAACNASSSGADGGDCELSEDLQLALGDC